MRCRLGATTLQAYWRCAPNERLWNGCLWRIVLKLDNRRGCENVANADALAIYLSHCEALSKIDTRASDRFCGY